jgi:heparanase 1
VGGNFWSKEAGVEIGVGAERVSPFDFGNPRLRNAAAALAPAYLRIGGSEADKIYYDLAADSPYEPPDGYEFVMTRPQWSGIHRFAESVGFDVFFTLNAGPGPRRHGAWTTSNAAQLMRAAAARGDSVAVWELGNEVNAYEFIHGPFDRVDGAQYARDVATARQLVDEFSPNALLAGSASAFWPRHGEVRGILDEFVPLGANDLDVLTWHYYPQQSRRCPVHSVEARVDTLQVPSNLDEFDLWTTHTRSLLDDHAPHVELWLGETGNAQCGGEPGVSDRFASSLWWVDQLGKAARSGQRISVRQTLEGSDYGLLSDGAQTARPDYWASLIWKRTMGPRVLATSSDDALLRSYAHCGLDGGVALAMVNIAEADRLIELDGEWEIWRIEADSLTSSSVRVNGVVARLGEDGAPPVFEPERVTGQIVMEPKSIVFAVRQGEFEACE